MRTSWDCGASVWTLIWIHMLHLLDLSSHLCGNSYPLTWASESFLENLGLDTLLLDWKLVYFCLHAGLKTVG